MAIKSSAAMILVSAVIGIASADTPAGTATSTHRKPKISQSEAERTALAQVPQGTVRGAELEREHGRLIWSFDIAIPNSQDIKEVQIDANNGAVVAIETETQAEQAEEAAADRHKDN
jgi:uncharacterized membrane protein YkoI